MHTYKQDISIESTNMKLFRTIKASSSSSSRRPWRASCRTVPTSPPSTIAPAPATGTAAPDLSAFLAGPPWDGSEEEEEADADAGTEEEEPLLLLTPPAFALPASTFREEEARSSTDFNLDLFLRMISLSCSESGRVDRTGGAALLLMEVEEEEEEEEEEEALDGNGVADEFEEEEGGEIVEALGRKRASASI